MTIRETNKNRFDQITTNEKTQGRVGARIVDQPPFGAFRLNQVGVDLGNFCLTSRVPGLHTFGKTHFWWYGCGSKMGTQNGTLANGNKD